MSHEKAEFRFVRRGNAKHRHNTRRGTRYFNHWFRVYACPVCGKIRGRKSRARFCRG